MLDLESAGKLIMTLGGSLLLVGSSLRVLSKVKLLGHLPMDIQIQRPGFSCFVPLASSILVSIILTVVLNTIVRLSNR